MLISRNARVLQPHSAQCCHRTLADLPFGIICDHASVDAVCGRAMCAPVLRCKGLGVLARTSPGPMREISCSRYALTHALRLTRPSTTHQGAGLHAQPARELPERGGCSPRLHAIVRGGAPKRPSLARSRPACAAGAARAAGRILLRAAGTLDCTPARPPARPPPARLPAHPSHWHTLQRMAGPCQWNGPSSVLEGSRTYKCA